MSEPHKVTVGIREIEPGFTMFVFEAPPTLDQTRLHSLLEGMNDWRRHYPDRRIEDLQIVRDKGLVRGLNVFWSLFVNPNPNAKTFHNFNFRVRNEVTTMYGHEYLEALMEDSAKFMVEVRQPNQICVLLSRRDITIVAYKARNEGFILSYEQFCKSLTPTLAKSIEKSFKEFKQSDAAGYHVVPLPDSYTAPSD